jgi:hypothetical protein
MLPIYLPLGCQAGFVEPFESTDFVDTSFQRSQAPREALVDLDRGLCAGETPVDALGLGEEQMLFGRHDARGVLSGGCG